MTSSIISYFYIYCSPCSII